VLNTQLSSAARPSFIGPIEITNLDFGASPPDVEIKDIRDVWRAFDDDEEEDYDAGLGLEGEYGNGNGNGSEYTGDYGHDNAGRRVSGRSSDHHLYETISLVEAGSSRLPSLTGHPGMGMGMGGGLNMSMGLGSGMDGDPFDDTASVFSSNRRQSIHAVGLGARGLGQARDFLVAPSLNGHVHGHGHGHGHAGSIHSHPFSPGGMSTRHPAPTHAYMSHPPSPVRPPNRPAPSSSSSSSIPSLQLHVNLSYTSDLTITLLTSLTVRYPSSSVFMSLPLKLSITGLQLAADIIVAFDGEKKRVHLTILDEDDGTSGVPVGQRLLPEMRIDSEIGHSDAHVLRNVGKIERFIADAVRKTLVDELVFPNFHTIAL
jgi:distribution and morphology protein 12